MPEAFLTFPAELNAVGEARRFVRDTLRGWDADDYDFGAPLVVTELATNAALHARTPFSVRLELRPDVLVIEVSDSSPRLPQSRHYSAHATTGRGLSLVGTLSVRHGVTPTNGGKAVWAHVAADRPIAVDLDLGDELGDLGPDGRPPSPPTAGRQQASGDCRARVAPVAA